ncbi:hypothetical protein K7X08_003720 [Anisodus acutangulus]|uniref:Uncharacterized protein n=1 Tax=Anisodus acutangulus TaxID=402998 RepID=A0A9Q1RJ17_9SOLA|nr:hypothetical protein K7X08_003720 [Anisodus acutangulus]
MEEEVKRAARAGDIDPLYRVIEREPLILKEIDEKEFVETPLHTAAYAGCTNFAIEMLSPKPSLRRKLNPGEYSPLDLALCNGHRDTEAAHKEMTIRGETAVHCAVISGSVQAFIVLIGWLHRTDNKDILDWKDNNGSTVLHIAAQTSQVEVVEHLTKERVDLDVKNQENHTALDIVADRIADDSSSLDVVLSATISSQRS